MSRGFSTARAQSRAARKRRAATSGKASVPRRFPAGSIVQGKGRYYVVDYDGGWREIEAALCAVAETWWRQSETARDAGLPPPALPHELERLVTEARTSTLGGRS